jgi:glycosyltransferase involved in cell wall biosynthesis
MFAAPGSDPALAVRELPVPRFSPSRESLSDVNAMSESWMREHHAYLGLMLELRRNGAERFDIIHNNSLHHLPVAMAEVTGLPVITTLHTPPTPWLESAVQFAPGSASFVAVSEHTARAWGSSVRATVVRNGVDTSRWIPGPGGDRAVWFGRLVPEKAPHLAIEAAKLAGVGLDLAGPIADAAYFESRVAPLLGGEIRYLGHLRHEELVAKVGDSGVALVTPAWNEPYGLVAAEALACGTPVAAFDRGALGEIVDERSGRLAPAGDVRGLAAALLEARTLSRTDARARAVDFCSLDRMVDEYEERYRAAGGERLAS